MSTVLTKMLDDMGLTREMAKGRYVIVLRNPKDDSLRVALDPGSTKPWVSTNRQYAGVVAKEMGGTVYSLYEAMQILERQIKRMSEIIMEARN